MALNQSAGFDGVISDWEILFRLGGCVTVWVLLAVVVIR